MEADKGFVHRLNYLSFYSANKLLTGTSYPRRQNNPPQELGGGRLVEDIPVDSGPLGERYRLANRASAETLRGFGQETAPMYHGIFAATFRERSLPASCAFAGDAGEELPASSG